MNEFPSVPLSDHREHPEDETMARARDFHAGLERRRTVRHLSIRPVARAIIDDCLRATPSGANPQPWSPACDDASVGPQRRPAGAHASMAARNRSLAPGPRAKGLMMGRSIPEAR